MANFIRHFDNVLENLEVTGKRVRHFDNDPLGTARTRTKKILEIPDQLGPGPGKFNKSRNSSDQHRKNFRNGGPWIPA